MAYTATITRIKNVRPHSNADAVKLATCHGNQVVIGLEHQEDELGIYFPTDGQLSHEFCYNNNLYRDNTKNIDPTAKPGMFDDNRRVRTQKFRGEKSDGFWVPLPLLGFIGKSDILAMENMEFIEINNIPICNKYFVAKNENIQGVKKQRTSKSSIMFKEHFDTEHFGKNIFKIKVGDVLVITEKAHGTSGRIGNVLVDKKLNWKDKIASKLGINIQTKGWEYLNGTRRVVIEESTGVQYHDNTIRDFAFNKFKDLLHKGETVFFEIVGYEPSGNPIMPSVATKKLGDKDFTKRYGETMNYSYGNKIGECSVLVYRITNTNEDGKTIDLSWNDVKERCSELGINYVYELGIIVASNGLSKEEVGDELNRDGQEFLTNLVEKHCQGQSFYDTKHIKEGVCIKIESKGLTPITMKHKSFEFKVLEGIVKDAGITDMEEELSY